MIKTSAVHPDIATATTLIPAGTRVIDNLGDAKEALYVVARKNGNGRMMKVDYASGKVSDVTCQSTETISDFNTDHCCRVLSRKSRAGQFRRFGTPTTRRPASWRIRHLDPPSSVDYSGIVADEVQVRARDGVMVPLSIVHRKDMKLDGSNPTLLYAYGSYGISSSPSFSPSRLACVRARRVFAVAHVRGGGENGEEWHLAGKDAKKINTINDSSTARSDDRSEVHKSGEAGRAAAARAASQWAARSRAHRSFSPPVLDEIPVSDQLREEFTANGPPNVPEFGSVKTEAGFKSLYATSAVQHVVPGGKYPAVMLTTAPTTRASIRGKPRR